MDVVKLMRACSEAGGGFLLLIYKPEQPSPFFKCALKIHDPQHIQWPRWYANQALCHRVCFWSHIKNVLVNISVFIAACLKQHVRPPADAQLSSSTLGQFTRSAWENSRAVILEVPRRVFVIWLSKQPVIPIMSFCFITHTLFCRSVSLLLLWKQTWSLLFTGFYILWCIRWDLAANLLDFFMAWNRKRVLSCEFLMLAGWKIVLGGIQVMISLSLDLLADS